VINGVAKTIHYLDGFTAKRREVWVANLSAVAVASIWTVGASCQVSQPVAVLLGQAKLIIKFLFPPACFFANTTKFSFYGNLHCMDFQNFHYCINEVFLHYLMNNEKWQPTHILFWKSWNGNLIINIAWPQLPFILWIS